MDEKSFFTWHQTPNDPLNLFARELAHAVEAPEGEAAYALGPVRQITRNSDPVPEVRGIRQRLLKYTREDGVALSAKLYTPPGYGDDIRLPTILYAYPLDHADASTASQVTGSDQEFIVPQDYKLLPLAGFAVIKPRFPIYGDPKAMYDNYLRQLVINAKAAVRAAVESGVADPARVGVLGHSHGAFMAANLLAHCNLFAAGAATSGSYNKTNTFFGFQNESRSLWEAPQLYFDISTVMHANKIKKPLLLMHGAQDANPSTQPFQSKLMYDAVAGTGGIAKLVVFPYEAHWYATREANQHMVYELIEWFNEHVKAAEQARGHLTQ